jgi:hypothetical protein
MGAFANTESIGAVLDLNAKTVTWTRNGWPGTAYGLVPPGPWYFAVSLYYTGEWFDYQWWTCWDE